MEVLQQQQVVIKNLGESLKGLVEFLGGVFLETGRWAYFRCSVVNKTC